MTTHKIQGGDTLSHLALRYFGDANKWPTIWEANKHEVRNPNKIKIGQVLVIPEESMKEAGR